ncbi:plasmid pRiA4b ORF-3 family protein [Microbacterium oryzae]|uniref:plasmid pRiA4b ORF-3 family protein n=1 Tax=Microbacterium oryzae TaxID=743009 RepID=UPI0025B0CE8B|nr:plasmid pRiA4b ORF-3 family protein [Microbacterium oryzae]MDN3310979.1 plasmid pRiA4b ORF-3 family protein [Microbacterium oryzae]
MEPGERLYLLVTLHGVWPEVWREFEIDGGLSVRQLHMALQVIMGWREMHLHELREGIPPGLQVTQKQLRWGAPSPDDPDLLDETEWTITGALEEFALEYEYDFGDGWLHIVQVHPEVKPHATTPPVRIMRGENRAPWEDSGGPDGYAHKREALADPNHPERRAVKRWLAETVGPWAPTDPTAFDAPSIQAELNLLFNPRGSGIEQGDLSGLVKVKELRPAGDVDEASPIVMFASNLPPAIRSELRQHLYRTAVLTPIEIDEETAARIIRPFAWLIEAVGADGLDLTTAGWLPPSVVLDGMTRLGWLDGWVGKGNREDLTPPIANLREVAQRMGIVRVQKGRLLLGAPAKKALGDSRALLRLVARGLYRGLQDAEVDAAVLHLLAIADGTPASERWQAVAFGMRMVGWEHPSGEFTATDMRMATAETDRLLSILFDRRVRAEQASEDLKLFAREALR